MKTLLAFLLVMCLASVSFSQTYSPGPEWKYTKLTLTGNAGTAVLDNKYMGGELQILAVSVDTDTLDTEEGTLTMSHIIRLPNSSTALDTHTVWAYPLDRADSLNTARSTVNLVKATHFGKSLFRVSLLGIDKLTFTKDALTTNTITLYIRQRIGK